MTELLLALILNLYPAPQAGGPTDGDVRKNWCEKNGGVWDKRTKTCERQ